MKIIQITYPYYIRWHIDFTGQSDPSFHFSDKIRKRILKAKERIEKSSTYRLTVEPVNNEYIDQFEPIYAGFIDSINGTKFDIRNKIIENPPHTYPYYAISLYCNNILAGGMIFSKRKDLIAVSYRVFPRNLSINLPISTSYIAETLLNKFALSHNIYHISHGKDRNIYGRYSAIGLSEYKLSIGCKPYIPEKKIYRIKKDSYKWNQEKPNLIFLWPNNNDTIIHARYICTKEQEEALIQKYPHIRSFITNASCVHNEHFLR